MNLNLFVYVLSCAGKITGVCISSGALVVRCVSSGVVILTTNYARLVLCLQSNSPLPEGATSVEQIKHCIVKAGKQYAEIRITSWSFSGNAFGIEWSVFWAPVTNDWSKYPYNERFGNFIVPSVYPFEKFNHPETVRKYRTITLDEGFRNTLHRYQITFCRIGLEKGIEAGFSQINDRVLKSKSKIVEKIFTDVLLRELYRSFRQAGINLDRPELAYAEKAVLSHVIHFLLNGTISYDKVCNMLGLPSKKVISLLEESEENTSESNKLIIESNEVNSEIDLDKKTIIDRSPNSPFSNYVPDNFFLKIMYKGKQILGLHINPSDIIQTSELRTEKQFMEKAAIQSNKAIENLKRTREEDLARKISVSAKELRKSMRRIQRKRLINKLNIFNLFKEKVNNFKLRTSNNLNKEINDDNNSLELTNKTINKKLDTNKLQTSNNLNKEINDDSNSLKLTNKTINRKSDNNKLQTSNTLNKGIKNEISNVSCDISDTEAQKNNADNEKKKGTMFEYSHPFTREFDDSHFRALAEDEDPLINYWTECLYPEFELLWEEVDQVFERIAARLENPKLDNEPDTTIFHPYEEHKQSCEKNKTRELKTREVQASQGIVATLRPSAPVDLYVHDLPTVILVLNVAAAGVISFMSIKGWQLAQQEVTFIEEFYEKIEQNYETDINLAENYNKEFEIIKFKTQEEREQAEKKKKILNRTANKKPKLTGQRKERRKQKIYNLARKIFRKIHQIVKHGILKTTKLDYQTYKIAKLAGMFNNIESDL